MFKVGDLIISDPNCSHEYAWNNGTSRLGKWPRKDVVYEVLSISVYNEVVIDIGTEKRTYDSERFMLYTPKVRNYTGKFKGGSLCGN